MGAKRSKKVAIERDVAVRSRAMTLRDTTPPEPAAFHTQVWHPGIRKWVLQCLCRFVPARTANEQALSGFLSMAGYLVTAEDVRTQLKWLASEGLVSAEQRPDVGMLVVVLTATGLEVAEGRRIHPGVERV